MKIIKIFITYYSIAVLFIWNVFAEVDKNIPQIWGEGLPWFNETKTNVWAEYIVNIIETMLQYVSVVAVIALMLSWVLYLFSAGEEEKTKKAKNWIIWALVWVIVSMSSWFLVNIINNFTFDTPTL